MAATLHIAPRLTSGRFIVLSQEESVDTNGLIAVSATFSVAPASISAINTAFYLDAPPPVPLSASLASAGALFLREYSTEKSTGLWTVTATYVGAKEVQSGLSRPFVRRDSELRVTDPIRFVAGYSIDPETQDQIEFYDYVAVQFVAQTIIREIACTRPIFDSELIEADAMRLISRVSYASIARGSPDVRTRFGYPSADTLLRRFRPMIQTSTAIDNITNRVFIATTTQEVIFDELAAATATIFD